MSKSDSFDVRPDVGIFNVIRHLPYKPQYALAEYIDNSISSWENNKSALKRLDPNYRLLIEIEIGRDRISVRDNAAGIAKKDYPRAFKPAELPPDRSGLNEFGMGMKTASIWLSNNWKVITTSLQDDETGVIEFDVEKMIKERTGIITPRFSPKRPSTPHGTEIILTNLNRKVNGQQVRRIKEHLANIYRLYLRTNEVTIRVFDEGEDAHGKDVGLEFEEMPALVAEGAYPGAPQKKVKWEKQIDIKLSNGRRIHGFAKVLAVASTSKAGFYLFRRNRVIVGASEPYRPEEIFGKSTTFAYQRIYGELTMEGFAVTHTKDGIIWGSEEEEEEKVIDEIGKALSEGQLDLVAQAKKFRVKGFDDPEKSAKAIDKSNDALEEDTKKNADKLSEVTETSQQINEPEPSSTGPLPEAFRTKNFSLQISGEKWEFQIETINAGNGEALFESEVSRNDAESTVICIIRLNLDDKFACNYNINRNTEFYDIILRFAVATSYAQAQSKLSGNTYTGVMVRNITKTLSNVLSGANSLYDTP